MENVERASRSGSRAGRAAIVGGLIVLATTFPACATPRAAVRPSAGAHLELLGDTVLPVLNAPGKPRVDVGGLSGAFYDPLRKRLYAVVDDRQRPRVIGFDVTLQPAVSLVARELVTLQPPPALPGNRTLDAEGIAPAPRGHWFVSSEGDPVEGTQPVAGIHEYTHEGHFVRTLPLPPAYHNERGSKPSGMRLNLSLEALSASPDGRWLFAGMESSLLQDGPAANFDHGAIVRLLIYDVRQPRRQPREYAYRTEPMTRPSGWIPTDGDAGVVDVLALDSTTLLVLERGYVVENERPTAQRQNTIRIFRVTLDLAAEITGTRSLGDRHNQPVLQKQLLLDLATIGGELSERLRALENFEAITFGPQLSDGTRTVLLLSDDNFSTSQVTALVALQLQR